MIKEWCENDSNTLLFNGQHVNTIIYEGNGIGIIGANAGIGEKCKFKTRRSIYF